MSAIPQTTTRWRLTSRTPTDPTDTLSTLTLEHDAPIPTLSPTQVLIKTAYLSLNYRDLLIATNQYGFPIPTPIIPGSDASGTVLAVGSSVTHFQPGDKVASSFFANSPTGYNSPQAAGTALGGGVDGVYAKYCVYEETGLVKLPEQISLVEGATLSCAGMTAWTALYGYAGTEDGKNPGRSLEGETVLVQGTGGVSVFALQIAKAAGATVIATTSSEEKEKRVRELGADHVINYKTTPNWGEVAKSLTKDNKGIDHIIEVGGANTLDQSFKAVAAGGTINIIGVLSGFEGAQPSLTQLIYLQAKIRGILVGNLEGYKDFVDYLAKKQIKPVVDEKRFKFEEYKEAIRYMESGKHFGKIIVEADPAQD
ncbi:zinc-type alcohol dehydrogenase-like protein [Ascobolus immersus RN42]|uniref:Zinc-type alcohol dehydrogenase-like protein n=1 Tax=Ascobolus immersus RN42 TaxID=1160509 RepID=A0A3N4ICC6_ASCIM|nr:zinc-type alcohol dehydrogenase-like protein [Ascobolus immersus RN42]